MHKEASQKLAAKGRGVGIDAQLNAQLSDDQKYHRIMQFNSKDCIFPATKEDIVFFSGNLYYFRLKIAQECFPGWISYDIHKYTLGFIQLPEKETKNNTSIAVMCWSRWWGNKENTKAETIFLAVKDVLIKCVLPINQWQGQAYDRASNMSGINNGVHYTQLSQYV